jgi:hypothetical protein
MGIVPASPIEKHEVCQFELDARFFFNFLHPQAEWHYSLRLCKRDSDGRLLIGTIALVFLSKN